MVTLSRLVREVQQVVYDDAVGAGLPSDAPPLWQGGTGARAYAEAISTYLAFAVNKYAMYGCSLVPWYTKEN